MFGLMRTKTHARELLDVRNQERAAHHDWADMFRQRNDERESRFEMQQRLEAVLELIVDAHAKNPKATVMSIRSIENAIGELPEREGA